MTMLEKLKRLVARRLFIVRFNFDLSKGVITYVEAKHRGIGKTTYLVKQCMKYELGLIVGSQHEKKYIKETFNFHDVFTMEEVKRYPHTNLHEFLVDETVNYKFLVTYYLHTHPKIKIVGGVRVLN